MKAYVTTKEDLKLLKDKTIGDRVRWVREKANHQNPSSFTRYKVAKNTNLAKSTITRIEDGTISQPQYSKLEIIASYLQVNADVFFDSYYDDKMFNFVIGEAEDIKEYEETYKTLNILDEAYQAKVWTSIVSLHSGEVAEEFEEEVELSPLEYEEFKEEIKWLFYKVKERRKTWHQKRIAEQKLNNREEFDE